MPGAAAGVDQPRIIVGNDSQCGSIPAHGQWVLAVYWQCDVYPAGTFYCLHH